MKNVKPTKAWSFSLIISSVCSLIIAITGIIGVDLPDMAKRIYNHADRTACYGLYISENVHGD